ncbi:hypothetical protein AKG16_19790 [Morganella morganii]|nr:hypothetical protein AKG16_19790 [Morganella morganii]
MLLKTERYLLIIPGMRNSRFNEIRLCNEPRKRFMTDERCTTINIHALVITFFRFGGDIAGTAGAGKFAAKRTFHHD